MTLYQSPPEAVTIDGQPYPVDTDFRVWVEFQGILQEKAEDGEKAEKLYRFMERLGLPPAASTLDALADFFSGASREKGGKSGKKRPRAFDFEQDSEYIYAAFRGAYGIDLTSEKLHWWTFKALFKALPDDCELCKIMRYRTADMKDVPKGQKQFYREMKARYALAGGSAPAYRTEEEMKEYARKRFAEAQARMSALRSAGQPDTAGAASESVGHLAKM